MKETIDKLKELFGKIESALKVIDLEKKKNTLKVLEVEMREPEFWDDKQKAIEVSQQAGNLKDQIGIWENLVKNITDLLEVAEMDQDDLDVNMRQDIDEQYSKLLQEYEQHEREIFLRGEHDSSNVIITIHAGAGGDDAQDWAEMLSRMYLRFTEKMGWQTTILDSAKGGEAGIKSMTMEINGMDAYGLLKSEHGVHRLVRLSPFDADHARHTSFALIEVLPVFDEIDEIDVDAKDLRIDTFMASGHGGQSVNTTYSAVRIVHKPTGISISCQNERSQMQNRETAMKILHAKLQQLAEQQRVEQIQDLKGEHREAAWGNQIRSYVLHPYKMVKDLRTGYEESDPDKVLDGELMNFIDAYLKWQATSFANDSGKRGRSTNN